jgi:hypothetical protein
MGYMKKLDIRIRSGGDDAIAAACELADLAKARRGYDDTMQAGEDITDVVTVLRGVGFSSVAPEAGDSASLLHRVVMAAADEIEHLRDERRWISVSERLPPEGVCLAAIRVRNWHEGPKHYVEIKYFDGTQQFRDEDDWVSCSAVTHWMPLPEPPEVK